MTYLPSCAAYSCRPTNTSPFDTVNVARRALVPPTSSPSRNTPYRHNTLRTASRLRLAQRSACSRSGISAAPTTRTLQRPLSAPMRPACSKSSWTPVSAKQAGACCACSGLSLESGQRKCSRPPTPDVGSQMQTATQLPTGALVVNTSAAALETTTSPASTFRQRASPSGKGEGLPVIVGIDDVDVLIALALALALAGGGVGGDR